VRATRHHSNTPGCRGEDHELEPRDTEEGWTRSKTDDETSIPLNETRVAKSALATSPRRKLRAAPKKSPRIRERSGRDSDIRGV
jgi:hypothetical protein